VTSLEPDDHQPVEQLEAGGWHDKQINRTNGSAGGSSSLAMSVRAVGPCTWPRSTGRPRSPACVARHGCAVHSAFAWLISRMGTQVDRDLRPADEIA
jgi:hypothetical protein